MKLAPTIKYNVQDIITKTIPIYYGFFIFIFLLLFVLSKIPSMHMNGSFSGISMNSSVLLIIIGLIFTRPSFRFLTQMGVSHKTQIAAKIIGIIFICAVVVAADRLVDLASAYLYKSSDITYESSEIFTMPFSDTLSNLQPFARELTVIGLAFSSRVMIFAAAVFVAMLYVRMNTFTKVIVSVGVPLLAIFVLPLSIKFFPEQMERIFNNLGEITGLSDGQPIKLILCMMGSAVVSFVLLYLLTRRAPIND